MKKIFIKFIGLLWFFSPFAMAANSNWTGPGSDFNTAGNWSAGVPGVADSARFNNVGPTAISVTQNTAVTDFTFNPGASAYTFTVMSSVVLQLGIGFGIVNNSGVTQTIVNNGGTITCFGCSAPALTNNVILMNNAGTLQFDISTTLGNATIINNVDALLRVATGATLGNVINTGTLDATLAPGTWSAGSLSGSGDFQLGSGHLTVGSNDLSTTVSGTLSGTGTLTKVGTGILTLAGTNSYTGATAINGGTLDLTGSLTSDVTVNAAGTLTGTGTLERLINNGSVTPQTSGVDTLTASSYSGTGTLNAQFYDGSVGTIRITGIANLTGGTLNVVGSDFSVGQHSLLSAHSLVGTFSTVNGPGSSLLTFSPIYTATDAFLVINFATPFASFAQNDNQRSVGANLNSAKFSSTADFTNAVNAIALLPAAQISSALGQISGDSLASFQTLNLHNADMFTHIMRDRAVHVSSTSCGVWVQGLGRVDAVDGNSDPGSPSWDATTGGFQAGYDLLADDNILFGFSGGYAESHLNINDRTSSGNTRSILSGIYANYKRDAWFGNSMAAYIHGFDNMNRGIVYGSEDLKAASSFDTYQFTTLWEAGYTFHPHDAWVIEPSVSLRQNHLVQESFTESGAPGLGLAVNNSSINSWVCGFGTGFRRVFGQDSSHPINLRSRLAWEHELGDRHNSLSAHFAETSGGSDFTVDGTPRSRDVAAIGLEGSVPIRTDLDLFVSYATKLAAAETMQNVSGGLRLRW